MVLERLHYLLQGLLVRAGAISKPGRDTAAQEALLLWAECGKAGGPELSGHAGGRDVSGLSWQWIWRIRVRLFVM